MKLRHLILAGMFVSFAQADDFSFTGVFTQDDDVQLFNFTVGALSTVTLRTWSYAGGTNAAGQVIASDGFDPILALFDASTGLLINQNDDGGGSVPADAETGAHFDTFLSSTLAPGNYTVSVMQFNNFANGPDLAAGFSRSGTGNFTTGFGCGGANFCDVTGDANDGHWAFDILNVSSATTVGSVPEPGSFMLLGSVALGLSIFAKKLRARA